jgi:hypothetical protein
MLKHFRGALAAAALAFVALLGAVPSHLALASGFTAQGVDQGAWTSYTPVLSASTGTVTTTGSVVGRYKVVGKTVYWSADVTVTTNGTAGSSFDVSLPLTASTAIVGLPASGVRNADHKAVVGLIGYGASTKASFFLAADGTYPASDGARFFVGGQYEVP